MRTRISITGLALLVILNIIMAGPAHAHSSLEQWVARYGSGLDDMAYDIAVDEDGNVYVTGQSLGPGGVSDFTTIKYDQDGRQVWVSRYSGQTANWNFNQANAIDLDSAGNVYVAGYSKHNISGYSRYVIVKYNALNGTEQWVEYAVESDDSRAASIAVNDSGQIYVTGVIRGAGKYGFATVKYDGSGQLIWESTYSGQYGVAEDYYEDVAIALDGAGNAYISGTGKGNGFPDFDIVSIKYRAADGEEQWVRHYDEPAGGRHYAAGNAVDAAGNLYVTGTSLGNDISQDYVTIKYGPAGEKHWVRRYDGPGGDSDDIAADIAVDATGNAYVTGSSMGTDRAGYATIKYDSGGRQIWVARYDIIMGGEIDARAIAVDAAGNVYVTGSFDNPGDSHNHGYATVMYDPGGRQMWVARYHGPSDSPHHYSMHNAWAIAVDGIGSVYVTGVSEGIDHRLDYATIKYKSEYQTFGFYDHREGRVYVKYGHSPGPADATYRLGPRGNNWEVLVGDFNGDDKDTFGFYDRAAGRVYVKYDHSAGSADATYRLGPRGNNWKVFVGDFNGDGKDTFGFYDHAGGQVYAKYDHTPGAADATYRLGPRGNNWEVRVGDYNGNGIDTFGFYDRAAGRVYVKYDHNAGAADATYRLGPRGNNWEVFAGDFNGDGKDTFGFYDHAGGQVYAKYDHSPGAADATYRLGPRGNNWVVRIGDFNGDGKDTFGFYDHAGGQVYAKYDHTPGAADATYRLGPRGNNWEVLVGSWR